MRTVLLDNVETVEELDAATAACIAGGMMAAYDDGTGNKARPGPPPEGALGSGVDQPYGESNDTLRYGAGPWDYGYGSPTGPWPV